ncbi:GNAT family N-acetyltransferase [Zeimonas arvi]|uniref:N-acetyltransferase domain-containing protein n=1 Tax=Zeimonas arvi TaxID=2498847 RepID=A0A5C8NY26_9BURK|nr:hypothetical protein [Zeimonas arvi]TXL65962.1 hypothetical protein FHP08_07740 [Zeimonas arvi]
MTLRSDIRQMGLPGWLAYISDRALSRLSRGRVRFVVIRLYLQPLPEEHLVPTKEGNNMRVGPISEDAFDASAFGRPPDAIRDRFRDGSLCIAATKNDELLGFMWLQRGTLRERIVRCEMRAEPESRVAWDYDFFIQPRYRLGRLFGRLWDAGSCTLREMNIEATVSWIRLDNRASEQAHARLGAKRIGWAAFLTVFGHQLMLSSFRPRASYAAPNRRATLIVDVEDLLSSRSNRPGNNAVEN